jgi:hypothetical protein
VDAVVVMSSPTFHQMPIVSDARPQQMPAGRAMGWLAFLMGMAWPRLTILAFWIFSDLLGDAYDGAVVPVLGFLLLPWTTMTYAVVWSISADAVAGPEWIAVAVALLADLATWALVRLLR